MLPTRRSNLSKHWNDAGVHLSICPSSALHSLHNVEGVPCVHRVHGVHCILNLNCVHSVQHVLRAVADKSVRVQVGRGRRWCRCLAANGVIGWEKEGRGGECLKT